MFLFDELNKTIDCTSWVYNLSNGAVMILISVSKSQQYKGQVEESINIINIKINTYYSESTIFTDLTTL